MRAETLLALKRVNIELSSCGCRLITLGGTRGLQRPFSVLTSAARLGESRWKPFNGFRPNPSCFMQAVLKQPQLSMVANASLPTVLHTDWTNASHLAIVLFPLAVCLRRRTSDSGPVGIVMSQDLPFVR